MEKMTFGLFTWQENPEVFMLQAVREPVYTANEDGTLEYTGMGPICRVITGSGVFRGEYAFEDFNSLHVLMATGKPMELFHPLWGKYSVLLSELELKNTSRDHYVEYKFTFREADSDGLVPPLPENWEKQY